MDTQKRILAVIQGVATKDAAPSVEEQLFETGVLDSFGLPDLVSGLEKEFNVSIPDSDLRPKNFASIHQIEQYLASRK
jgi:D-alanine--poly(phosphoribitol) ligase subunit 2